MASHSNNETALLWTALLGVGMLILVAGFVWPLLPGEPSQEAKSSAAEYLEAGRALEAANAGNPKDRPANMDELRERYQQAKQDAEQLRDAPGRTAFWLKLAGGLLAAVGVVGYYIQSKS